MTDYIPRYALLEALLAQLGLVLKGLYTISDAAQIFGVSRRTIQDWIRDGKLNARNLGRYRFLSEDLESFLQNSVIKHRLNSTEHGHSQLSNPEGMEPTQNRRRGGPA